MKLSFFFGDRTSQKKHHTHKGMKLIFRLQVFSGIDHIIQETQQPSDGVVAGAANVQGEPCTQSSAVESCVAWSPADPGYRPRC